MLNTNRTIADFTLFKGIGNLPYTNVIVFVPRGICDSKKWELLSNSDDIRNLPRTYLDTPTKMTIASESNDDNFNGIGAQAVIAAGLNENYELYTEFLALDGQNPVSTQGDYIRFLEMLVFSIGSNTDPDTGDKIQVGNIWCGLGPWVNGVPNHKLLGIGEGTFYNDPDSREGIFTIPTDVLGVIRSLKVTVNSEVTAVNRRNGVIIQFAVRPPGFDFFFKFTPFFVQDQFDIIPEISPIPSRSDIQFRVLGFDNKEKNVTVETGIELIKVE